MKYSTEVEKILGHMITYAKANRHEFITAEHLLYSSTFNEEFINSFKILKGDIEKLRKDLEEYFNENIEKVEDAEPEASESLSDVLIQAGYQAASSECEEIKLTHIINAILELEESYAVYYIFSQGIDAGDLIYEMCEEERDIEIKEEKVEVKDEAWRKYVTCLNDDINRYPPLIGREDPRRVANSLFALF